MDAKIRCAESITPNEILAIEKQLDRLLQVLDETSGRLKFTRYDADDPLAGATLSIIDQMMRSVKADLNRISIIKSYATRILSGC